ncbi:Rhodanese domain-containing protein [Spironucleus salmonicida]|uniref:Rhodanese domain-containing protein n=1 Tax=Spironucleus salmonicida TaxID=348837 RepID=V6LUX4_9EUKA|nr:Rhodanese domain-containing protein [Spironucleus salmonicida]|eukprot:EST48432.1 Rhodanese domain-containing protein [Spironucleus salmonicida]
MQKSQIKFCNPSDLLKLQNAIIIDVRNYDYNEGGHFEKAINIPIEDITSEQSIEKLSSYSTIAVYCMYSQQRGPAAAIDLMQIFPDKKIVVCCGGFCAVRQAFKDMILE